MRRPRSSAVAFAGCLVLLSAPLTVLPTSAAPHESPRPAPAVETLSKPAKPAKPPERAKLAERFGAKCRIVVDGSRVVAYCHNPYPETDRVSLHIECERWWDIDSDSARVAADPAMTVRLSGRCWKEIGAAWVSHDRPG